MLAQGRRDRNAQPAGPGDKSRSSGVTDPVSARAGRFRVQQSNSQRAGVGMQASGLRASGTIRGAGSPNSMNSSATTGGDERRVDTKS